jgi:hypothetical protein
MTVQLFVTTVLYMKKPAYTDCPEGGWLTGEERTKMLASYMKRAKMYE